jgi:hypothetical protein
MLQNNKILECYELKMDKMFLYLIRCFCYFCN